MTPFPLLDSTFVESRGDIYDSFHGVKTANVVRYMIKSHLADEIFPLFLGGLSQRMMEHLPKTYPCGSVLV
jgi:hypothetical protein